MLQYYIKEVLPLEKCIFVLISCSIKSIFMGICCSPNYYEQHERTLFFKVGILGNEKANKAAKKANWIARSYVPLPDTNCILPSKILWSLIWHIQPQQIWDTHTTNKLHFIQPSFGAFKSSTFSRNINQT